MRYCTSPPLIHGFICNPAATKQHEAESCKRGSAAVRCGGPAACSAVPGLLRRAALRLFGGSASSQRQNRERPLQRCLLDHKLTPACLHAQLVPRWGLSNRNGAESSCYPSQPSPRSPVPVYIWYSPRGRTARAAAASTQHPMMAMRSRPPPLQGGAGGQRPGQPPFWHSAAGCGWCQGGASAATASATASSLIGAGKQSSSPVASHQQPQHTGHPSSRPVSNPYTLWPTPSPRTF